MTRYDFTPLFHSTVGFDRLARMIDSALETADSSQNYPLYNIEADGEDRYRISIAAAGFSEEELTIETNEQTLTISGQKSEKTPETLFLHRGIANRDFVRKFQLADHVKVTGANLVNGLLTIDLVREIPEEKKPRTIEIRKSAPKTLIAKAKQLIEGEKKNKPAA
ncbi:Hsp20 family protein [Kiloniella laminariae]|uniref:Hsp20 family protein n=1 Tax=Kiloniella laminariae TaxID=454162 RepID=A0ABT4LGH4_9PROT|nr:Hsp20 family protein [Kiloniella laminariae]MCZ4280205.1 Hsp20 family protein [Kiloniella laminariae]